MCSILQLRSSSPCSTPTRILGGDDLFVIFFGGGGGGGVMHPQAQKIVRRVLLGTCLYEDFSTEQDICYT